MSSIRWAVNVGKWEPSEQQFLLASSCIQSEEKDRIDKFVFKKDVKSSLIGRLMMRKFISESTGLPYNTIKISRDANNKPIFDISDYKDIKPVSFNISHHGSYTVLAGEIGNKNIGVDVMKLEYTGGKSIEEFFRIMNRNFSESEWRKIKESSNSDKIGMFCRNWALKESYLKATGVGITLDLQKIDFRIGANLMEDKVVTDTSLFIDNKKQPWYFEESLLDQFHCVAVALEGDCPDDKSLVNNNLFKKLTPEQILENVIPILPNDTDYCKKYFSKQTN